MFFNLVFQNSDKTPSSQQKISFLLKQGADQIPGKHRHPQLPSPFMMSHQKPSFYFRLLFQVKIQSLHMTSKQKYLHKMCINIKFIQYSVQKNKFTSSQNTNKTLNCPGTNPYYSTTNIHTLDLFGWVIKHRYV